MLDIPNVGLTSSVPLDYMHLLCLGVVKKLLVSTWTFDSPPHNLEFKRINCFSDAIINLPLYIPREFARKPRGLKEKKHWNATEFRQLPLYTSPIVLRKALRKSKYTHFLSLTIAFRILLDNSLLNSYIDYAEDLLKHFVKSTKILHSYTFLTTISTILCTLWTMPGGLGTFNSLVILHVRIICKKIKKSFVSQMTFSHKLQNV